MGYSQEEFEYLCALFDASRDALRRHPGWEDLAEEFDELGEAVRRGNLSTQVLERIKQAIINSFFMERGIEGENYDLLRDLRGRALLRTVGLLKKGGGSD